MSETPLKHGKTGDTREWSSGCEKAAFYLEEAFLLKTVKTSQTMGSSPINPPKPLRNVGF